MNYVECGYNGDRLVLTNKTAENLKSRIVKNFYRSGYSLLDFVVECFNSFSWNFYGNGKVDFTEFINQLGNKYLEVEYLKDDILMCIE